MRPNFTYRREIEAMDIGQLVRKELSGGALSEEEAEHLRDWLDAFDSDRKVLGDLADQAAPSAILEELRPYRTRESLGRVLGIIRANQKKQRIRRLARLGVAACLLIGLGLGALLWPRVMNSTHPETAPEMADISPGGNKAILVLPDGKQVDLSEDNEALRLTQNSLTYENGSMIMDDLRALLASYENAQGDLMMTTLTPKGGKYRIELPDGSKVWLNAASTIRHPIDFGVGPRVVYLEGEAYFEISKVQQNGKAQPFQVKTRHQTVEVLGTTFNVSAYQDEDEICTTLLEGAVRVADELSGLEYELMPGEQTLLTKDGFIKQEADVGHSVAWKDGFFQFKRADIQTVMRQISRWYNVDVRYEGIPEDISITGKAYRNVNASQALEILQHLDIPFRIEKDQIVITKRMAGHKTNAPIDKNSTTK